MADNNIYINTSAFFLSNGHTTGAQNSQFATRRSETYISRENGKEEIAGQARKAHGTEGAHDVRLPLLQSRKGGGL
jgi:hypothetical protein